MVEYLRKDVFKLRKKHKTFLEMFVKIKNDLNNDHELFVKSMEAVICSDTSLENFN